MAAEHKAISGAEVEGVNNPLFDWMGCGLTGPGKVLPGADCEMDGVPEMAAGERFCVPAVQQKWSRHQ